MIEKKKIEGNISGIRQSYLEAMQALYDMSAERTQFLGEELHAALCQWTERLGREIAVYISREGKIQSVNIGDSSSAALPDMRLNRNLERLCGLRCIHTHPNGNPKLSSVDEGSLRRLRLDAMSAIAVGGSKAGEMSVAFLTGEETAELDIVSWGPSTLRALNQSDWEDKIQTADQLLMESSRLKEALEQPERAILVGIEEGKTNFDSLGELAELVKTAGAEVVGIETQKRSAPDTSTYIGRGKLEEIRLKKNAVGAGLLVFDDELTAVQIRNLEAELGATIIDRTALILDIFAGRAKSHEGKLQVELAQLKYRLPRLTGQGTSLSRQGGGIGSRGPGEKKLETDKRRIRREVQNLEHEIEEISKQRALRRVRRERNDIPVIALVGYTNAGKSTLLNALSGSDVEAEDKLFATLDPVTRSIELPEAGDAVLTDTVGFIRKLPHDLITAFRSTLEETIHADLIIHVVDASSSEAAEQMRVVEGVLDELGVEDTPILIAYNKADRLFEQESEKLEDENCICISALTGEGLDTLTAAIDNRLRSQEREIDILIPYARGDAEAFVRRNAKVLEESFEEDGWKMHIRLGNAVLGALEKLMKA